MHMQVAKTANVLFLTGENKLIEKYKIYYDKSLSYEELRKMFNV